MEIADKVVLITGGAVRVGRAIAWRLAAEGARVIVHYRSSRTEAETLTRQLGESHGAQAWALQGDLRSAEVCRALIRESRQRAGRVDILINNAGVFHKDAFPAITEEGIVGMFWPNLFAPLFLIQAFAESGSSGKVVNLLDKRIAEDDTACVPYLLSKKGLAEVTRLAALAYAPAISVNGVAPGAVLPPPGEAESYLAEKAGPVPLRRRCTPEEVAEAVLFLLEQDALTGQVIYVDGGQHLLGNPVR